MSVIKILHLQPLHVKLEVGIWGDALHVALLRWTFYSSLFFPFFFARGAHVLVVSAPLRPVSMHSFMAQLIRL